MNQIDEIKDILCQQIKLLAEKSSECKKTEGCNYYSGLTEYSEAMRHITNSYVNLLDAQARREF